MSTTGSFSRSRRNSQYTNTKSLQTICLCWLRHCFVSLDGSRLMIKDGAAVSSICIDQKVFLRAVGLYVCANGHSNRTNTLLTVNDSLTEKARFIFGHCLQAAYPARCGPHQLLQLAKGTAMIKHPSNELGRNP